MRTLYSAFLAAILFATPGFAAEQTVRGTISDVMCGASHAGMPTKMTDKECTQFCAGKGAQYVLVADGKIYKLSNHNAELRAHAGETVSITGDVKGDTIKVSRVEPSKG
jgi:hypothetical protein